MQYTHTQPGTLIRVCMVLVSALCIWIGIFSYDELWITLLLCIGFPTLFIFVGWLFHSLTIEVDREELRHYFGVGFWKKSYQLHDIESVKVVRNCWVHGWGIRLTLHGWLYNVSGFDAVEIKLKLGRTFRLGTDDTCGVEEAIKSVLSS